MFFIVDFCMKDWCSGVVFKEREVVGNNVVFCEFFIIDEFMYCGKWDMYFVVIVFVVVIVI